MEVRVIDTRVLELVCNGFLTAGSIIEDERGRGVGDNEEMIIEKFNGCSHLGLDEIFHIQISGWDLF